MNRTRIYADFQNLDDGNRLRLTCTGTVRDLEREEIRLRDGLSLTFYTDDADDEGGDDELLVEGVVEYDPDKGCWVAAVDWKSLRHASEINDEKGASPVMEPSTTATA